MKKILCLALVLILTMSVAMTASAAPADDIANALGNFDLSNINFEIPKFASLDEAFNAFAEFIKFESIMVYVDQFHAYMYDFYVELNTALKGFGFVINSILDTFLAGDVM